jgi:hypothetical protein
MTGGTAGLVCVDIVAIDRKPDYMEADEILGRKVDREIVSKRENMQVLQMWRNPIDLSDQKTIQPSKVREYPRYRIDGVLIRVTWYVNFPMFLTLAKKKWQSPEQDRGDVWCVLD